MTEDDREAFATAVFAVFEVYGAEPSHDVIDIWWAALRHLDLPTFRAALSRHVRNPDTGQFRPKPADVIRECTGTTASAATIAWARLIRAVRDHGSWVSVAFDDPIIHVVVRDLGGWPAVCAMPEKEQPFAEKRFRDAYQAWLSRGFADSEVPRYLPGTIEAQNASSGHAGEIPLRMIGDPNLVRALLDGAKPDGGRKPIPEIAAIAKSKAAKP